MKMDNINNMKNMNKSTGYLIVIIFWLVVTALLSSCYTIKEMNMTSGQRATQCNYVNR